MLLPLHKPAKITRQRLELVPHPLLFNLDLLQAIRVHSTGWGRKESCDVRQHGVARYVERDVRREQTREAEELRCRLGLCARELILSGGEVLGAAPRRAEEHDVNLARGGRGIGMGPDCGRGQGRGVQDTRCERAEVGQHELDARRDAVQRGIVACKCEARRGCVERDDWAHPVR
jgi:hypothetical protein